MKLNRRFAGALLCAVGVWASGCSQPVVLGEVANIDFEQRRFEFDEYEVVLGATERQTVLTGFLLGGAFAELVVITQESDVRRLDIYAFEGGSWAPSLQTMLRPDVRFVDVASIDGKDRLITYAPGSLRWFDPASESEQKLVSVISGFDPPRENEIPHVDITRDLNGDGRDDLVVPDVEGFRVFLQNDDGTFADPVRIGPATDLSGILGADGYRYDPWSQSRVHEVDFDRDGRGDLVFWNEDHFEVHRQDERGQFHAMGESFATDVSFDSDQISTLTTGDMVGTVLHSLADLNGDGVCDLTLYSLKGRRNSKKRSSYQVHFGAATTVDGKESTVFGAEAGLSFRSDGRIPIGMLQQDFDGDGQLDLMITSFDPKFLGQSLWKKIKGFMGEDVRLSLEFYRSRSGVFSDQPDSALVIAMDGFPSHQEPGWVPLGLMLQGGKHEQRHKSLPTAFNTTLRFGDVTGDGLADLIKCDHPRVMNLHLGVPGPELFAQRAQSVSLAMPNDEEFTWLVDLNRDGKQDILMHHPFTLKDGHGARKKRPGTEPHRVTMLIGR